MPFDPERQGAYFVTIVTANRECSFTYLRIRSIVERGWLRLSQHFHHATLDAWVVMPNHLHGIVVLTRRNSGAKLGGSLGAIVGNFKSITARRVNRMRRTPGAGVAAELLRTCHSQRA